MATVNCRTLEWLYSLFLQQYKVIVTSPTPICHIPRISKEGRLEEKEVTSPSQATGGEILISED
ncbi:hypothetical protein E2320_017045 [Naja naja]|nr:hypothetical protein E2320_017045 [Naja naja]